MPNLGQPHRIGHRGPELGIAPDLEAGWTEADDDAARARKAGEAIARALPR